MPIRCLARRLALASERDAPTMSTPAAMTPAASLLGPLEEFGELHASARRRHGRRLIDLSFPNPAQARDRRGIETLRQVAGRLDVGQLQYSPFGGLATARRRVAQALARQAGLRYRHSEVFLTPGATAALVVAFSAALSAGDEVLIAAPCWLDYPLYLDRLGITWQLVSLTAGGRLDCAALADRWGPRTRAVVISQPNCPTGTVATEAELRGLAGLLESRRNDPSRPPLLISDEAHKEQVWSGSFVSPACCYDNTISVSSFGKAWSLQGQRAGYIAVSPRAADRQSLLLRVERAVRATGTCAPTLVMQHVMAELCELTPDVSSLAADQVLVRDELGRAGVAAVAGQATAFVYVRCPGQVDDWAFARLAAREGVLVLPSAVFHHSGHYRLALNVSGERLCEGVRRVAAVHQRAATGGSDV